MKRLSLFLLLILALSAMLIACAEKPKKSSETDCPTPNWNLIPEDKNSPLILQINSYYSIIKDNLDSANIARFITTDCSLPLPDGAEKANFRDCFNAAGAEDQNPEVKAHLNPTGYSIIALYREGDKLHISTRVQMDENSSGLDSTGLSDNPDDRYQFIEYAPITVTDYVLEPSCEAILNPEPIQLTGWTAADMQADGSPKDGSGRIYTQNPISLKMNFKTFILTLGTTLKGKDDSKIGNKVDSEMQIKASMSTPTTSKDASNIRKVNN